MILVIDNYDSFTYNLVQYLGELGADTNPALARKGWIRVVRNDKMDIADVYSWKPTHIVISPGPGTPKDAGISKQVIKEFAGKIPILGVCLGHQCIGEVFGGNVVKAHVLMHGKTSLIYHNEKTILRGLSNPFEAIRYHSLLVERDSFPDCLEIIAETKEKEIMGLRHRKYALWGVQFHPESILTIEGKKILQNFLQYRKV